MPYLLKLPPTPAYWQADLPSPSEGEGRDGAAQ